ncbi:G5 domain-containing protein [Actinoplanes sp. G11-F43]|uniref:G5 domain-containing protein n=1 Tax=Actinoplanes sp. G11-F43 TaxID=3424130 RepID=UPI003D339C47
MTAGAAAMFVVVGGSAAGVATMFGPGPESTTAATQTAVDDTLGAPMLEEDPEVVSRAAAAAQPLPRRPGATPPVPTPAATAGVPTPPVPAPARTTTTTTTTRTTADQLSRARVTDDRADRTGPRPARTTASKTAGGEPSAAEPVVTTRTDVETRAVPFDTEVVRDSSMPRGTRRIEVDGRAGEETLRYLVTLTDGRQTARRLLTSSITKEPQNRVVAVGSRRHLGFDPECDRALHLCLPWGRSAPCPDETKGETKGEPTVLGRVLISDEDLDLLGPGGLNAFKLEAACEKAETQAETKAHTRAETKAHTRAETKTETQAETRANAQADTKTHTQAGETSE